MVASLSRSKDAGRYITRLPKAVHEAAEWQAATKALILIATRGGPTMLARIGVMQALNRHVERVFNRRLFREESNEQRSRPNDLQQTMGWSRS